MESENRGLDLEKELTCSVSLAPPLPSLHTEMFAPVPSTHGPAQHSV